jgi:hypothetical protein
MCTCAEMFVHVHTMPGCVHSVYCGDICLVCLRVKCVLWEHMLCVYMFAVGPVDICALLYIHTCVPWAYMPCVYVCSVCCGHVPSCVYICTWPMEIHALHVYTCTVICCGHSCPVLARVQ